ncbi:MAG: dioxygenase [Alphaproteobacteria bacterium MedPE-SWcel]|nr:MAG: dioxygenase [Alphaproteobacteria bacterium MedPE-SWcel]
MSIFHLAYNVDDLDAARDFYGGTLGCKVARSADSWVDFDFFGHQISLHLGEPFATARTGHVGEHLVPMPHLGVILPLDQWQSLAERLHAAGVEFEIPPTTRFKGEPGEQSTMFFYDPAGNPIEIKGFANMDGIFAT